MGIDRTGQVVLMIHCGSRGFGHQVCILSMSQTFLSHSWRLGMEFLNLGLPLKISSVYKLCFHIKKVATDALVSMEKAMKRDNIEVNDRQLACARINSKEGQDYLNGNYLL